MNNLLKVGRIINAHGIKGEAKIFPLTDDPSRFHSLKTVYVEKEGVFVPLTIFNVRLHKNFILVTFNEINSRNGVEALKGMFLSIKREDAIELAKDQYFISDLIGVMIYTVEGEEIGKIKEVLQAGPTDIYIINTMKKDILVPALKEFFLEIDTHNKTAKANIPKEFMEL